jgi:GT2 family glycosyltransferase
MRRVLDAYLVQTPAAGAFEVLVVDNGSRAGLADAYADHVRAAPHTPVRILAVAEPGRAAANNAGARAARADILIFVADDFIPAPTLVGAHRVFQASLMAERVGIGPAFFPEPLARDPFRHWMEATGHLFGVPFRTAGYSLPPHYFYVGNASLRRTLFDRLGGFDEAFQHDVGDDSEFGCRLAAADIRSTFLPKALAWHDHEVTFAERLEAVTRGGAASRICESMHPGDMPWAALVATSIPVLETEAARAVTAERASSTPATRADCYRRLLNLAFVRGYLGAAP